MDRITSMLSRYALRQPDSYPSESPDEHAVPSLARNDPPVAPQAESKLLSIPTEIRLLIFKNMTLSPASPDCLRWMGAYFTCRQIHQEMRDALKPEHDLSKHLSSIRDSWPPAHPVSADPGPLHQVFGLVQDVTVCMPIPRPNHHGCFSAILESVYSLWLDRLYITMTGNARDRAVLPWGDLKSLPPRLFADFVAKGKVNCRSVTFTLQELADVEGGREIETSLETVLDGTNVSCILTIVQDKRERQSERTYFSAMRFKAPPSAGTSSMSAAGQY